MKKHYYRSGFEDKVAANLKQRGVDFKYEPMQLTYYIKKRGGVCCSCGSKDVKQKHTYTPDFELPNGIIVEAKGHFTGTERTKMVEVIKENPGLDIRMLFMRDNFISKNKKQKYSEWCAKNNIKCAFVLVPEEWLV